MYFIYNQIDFKKCSGEVASVVRSAWISTEEKPNTLHKIEPMQQDRTQLHTCTLKDVNVHILPWEDLKGLKED